MSHATSDPAVREPSGPDADSRYVGNELELFREARNWKAYFASFLKPYLRGDVLEVGAGIGSTGRVLSDRRQKSWTALEPDPALAIQLKGSVAREPYPCEVQVVVGTLASLPSDRRFDAILYIDVLEHIENDVAEMAAAADRLGEGGVLAVLAPAHQWLFSEFDARVGHFRRYTRSSLSAAVPPKLRREQLRYLDTVGLLMSASNRLLLHQSTPTAAQIRFWDGWVVPISRRLDPLLGGHLGKSVVGVWRKPTR